MQQEDIAYEVIGICDRTRFVVDELAPFLGEVYAAACREQSAGAIKTSVAGMMGTEDPFGRIRSCAASVAEGWSGWSAEMSNGMRMPEYIADLLEYSDYTYYAGHLARELGESPGFDAAMQVRPFLFEIRQSAEDINRAISPLIGRYGA